MKISLKDGIMETVQNYPATAEVFRSFGMGCLGCAAKAHGMDLDRLLTALNAAAE